MTISRVAFLLALASGAISANAQLTFTQLGPLTPAYGTWGNGVSGNGTFAVGNGGLAVSTGRAIKWTGGIPTNMGSLSGYMSSTAVGASFDGSVIIGTCTESPASYAPTRATRWVGTTLQDLGILPNGHSSRAWGVSGDGQVVVGLCFMQDLNTIPFRWSQSSGMVPMGTSNGLTAVTAFGVNADGSMIAGSLSVGRAYRWTESGGYEDLGSATPGGGSSALAISADGNVVVGATYAASNQQRAMRWTSDTGMHSLGLLPNGTSSNARDTNGDGSIVVGQCFTTTGQRAFIWTAGTGMLDLTTFMSSQITGLDGWILYAVEGISDDGATLVGWGTLNGVVQGYRITGITFEDPCPECAADFDANGGVDGGDLAAFIVELETGSQCADVDQNGGIDGGDVGAFFLLFEAGGC